MTSKAEATFTCKSFGSNLLPKDAPEVKVVTQFKKKNGDSLFTLQLNDDTLRGPQSMKGVVLSVEQKMKGGVKGTLAYMPAKKDAIGTLQVEKRVNDSDLTLKATYQLKGDVLTVSETWKFDKNNKIVGTYNFAKEELVASAEHIRGSLKLGGQYSFKSEKPLLSLEKKQGKDTLTATYAPKDEAAVLTWQHKPFKTVLKGKAGKGGFTAESASLVLTKEFEI